MADEINVQIKFVIDRDGKRYQDALYIPQTDYLTKVSQADIDTLKEDRYTKWANHVKAASVVEAVKITLSQADALQKIRDMGYAIEGE